MNHWKKEDSSQNSVYGKIKIKKEYDKARQNFIRRETDCIKDGS
ncbi:hypothetical protein HMPREF3213_02273 [Heyndrickxia coagulans]|uniref:Uncharacterized protein n=1 Tax=Heyndrickxia coagulans TaxID=1398 RepID=A0A0C5CBN9_HEYCO|nr:hypothetical protein SB48_HM08orf03354 [Heyndrickxia coagulans]KWZ80473.1 hypothetical protein HMPREF3213_02273 [Heyndrickxia coagulans]KYC61229.1 hypothetical protein B4100_3329 [Heyndrickxia coagulans]